MTVGGFLLTISCNDDFLSPSPVDRIAEENIFNSPAGIQSHLASLYDMCPIEDFYWPDEAARPSLWADEAVADYASSGYNPGNIGYWGEGYRAIRYLNNFIAKLPESTAYANQVQEDDALGQAYALRAITYFALVRLYGGVPILTEVQELTGDPTDLHVARSTEEQVMDQILSDFDMAISKLSENTSPYVLNKWSALALKSTAALHAASIAKYSDLVYDGGTYMNGLLGMAKSKADGYFEQAKSAALQVIQSGNYELYDYAGDAYEDKIANYERVFFDETSANKERIFVSGYNYPDKTHWYDVLVTPFSFRSGVGYSSNNCPDLDMVEKFEYVNNRNGAIEVDGKYLNGDESDPLIVDDPNELFQNKDPRFMHNILYPGRAWRGDEIEIYVASIVNGETIPGKGKDGIAQPEATATGFYMAKYLQRTPARALNEGGDVDWQVIRYAEVLLNYAEACFETGENGEALKYVNSIRKRAGIQELTEVTLEDIRHEIDIEFFGENNRFWNMKRWRIAHVILDNTLVYAIWPIKNEDTGEWLFNRHQLDETNFKKTFQPKNYYTMIPQDEIEKNPLLEQNFGY